MAISKIVGKTRSMQINGRLRSAKLLRFVEVAATTSEVLGPNINL